MGAASIEIIDKHDSLNRVRAATGVWLLTAVYYFFQYALRSAPAVMMPELSSAFNISALGVASIVGLFYYGYSPFSLIAGAAMDRIGPQTPSMGSSSRWYWSNAAIRGNQRSEPTAVRRNRDGCR
jgi:sugar phosphate permease